MSETSSRRTGGARPVAPRRLADFEGEQEQEITLPPRRQGPRARVEQPSGDLQVPTEPRPVEPVEAAEGGPEAAPTGVRTPFRASNAQVPMDLIKAVTAHCRAKKITHGELIIAALEDNATRLGELITPAATVGGSLFPPMSTSANRARTEEVTVVPLNFRLPLAHFEVLDALVTQVGAPSRSRLISAALAAYLKP